MWPSHLNSLLFPQVEAWGRPLGRGPPLAVREMNWNYSCYCPWILKENVPKLKKKPHQTMQCSSLPFTTKTISEGIPIIKMFDFNKGNLVLNCWKSNNSFSVPLSRLPKLQRDGTGGSGTGKRGMLIISVLLDLVLFSWVLLHLLQHMRIRDSP